MRKSELEVAVERLDMTCDVVDNGGRVQVGQVRALVSNARKVIEEYHKEKQKWTEK